MHGKFRKKVKILEKAVDTTIFRFLSDQLAPFVVHVGVFG